MSVLTKVNQDSQYSAMDAKEITSIRIVLYKDCSIRRLTTPVRDPKTTSLNLLGIERGRIAHITLNTITRLQATTTQARDVTKTRNEGIHFRTRNSTEENQTEQNQTRLLQ